MNYQQAKATTLLGMLRGLVPLRALSYYEAERIAELQANRLRELLGISRARLPEEAISQFPRVDVRRDTDMPVSGLTHWDRGRWLICLNANEPEGRQRFSLAHEFKHVLDHTTKSRLYRDKPYLRAGDQAERIADYFAGCLLMPKRHVKRLFGERLSLIRLSDAFGVTPRAMHVRLSQLGLVEPTPRCGLAGPLRGVETVYERRPSGASRLAA